jgi:osmoprotectant transport system permease protein
MPNEQKNIWEGNAMIKYISHYYDKIGFLFLEHIQMVSICIATSFSISLVLSVLITRKKWLAPFVINFFNIVFCIPSLVLFTLLIPLSGLGMTTGVIAVTLYNVCFLTRNIVIGFDSVDRSVIESAAAMGLSQTQILLSVEFPLALPFVVTAFRLGIIGTISMVTTAAAVNAGGIGELLFDGLRTQNWNKIIIGVALVSVLVLILNAVLIKAENHTTHKALGDDYALSAKKFRVG